MNDGTYNPEQRIAAVRDQINRTITRTPKMIWVTFQREGIHQFPAALEDPNLADVKFLGYPHRHIFKFKVWIEVTHDDRDIEFVQFKRWLERLYNEQTLALDNKSCEMVSDDLYRAIATTYPFRDVWIEVSEDGENGSFTKYDRYTVQKTY